MTLTVTIEPAFLALTTTPSMAPSWSEVTTPVRAVAGAVCAPADSGIADRRMAAAATAKLSLARIDFSLLVAKRRERRPLRALRCKPDRRKIPVDEGAAPADGTTAAR